MDAGVTASFTFFPYLAGGLPPLEERNVGLVFVLTTSERGEVEGDSSV